MNNDTNNLKPVSKDLIQDSGIKAALAWKAMTFTQDQYFYLIRYANQNGLKTAAEAANHIILTINAQESR